MHERIEKHQKQIFIDRAKARANCIRKNRSSLMRPEVYQGTRAEQDQADRLMNRFVRLESHLLKSSARMHSFEVKHAKMAASVANTYRTTKQKAAIRNETLKLRNYRMNPRLEL